MISDTYIDLPLPIEITRFVAPDDGWLYLEKEHNGVWGFIDMENETHNYHKCTNNLIPGYLAEYIECRKGDVVRLHYYADSKIKEFRFYIRTKSSKKTKKVIDIEDNTSYYNPIQR